MRRVVAASIMRLAVRSTLMRLALVSTLVAATAVWSACQRPPPSSGAGSSDAALPAVPPEAVAAEVETLRAAGPSVTPYDRPPRLVWDDASETMLLETLLPVLGRHGLPASTRSRYWLLVGADGRVHEVILQTGYANEDFHRAGAEVAAELRFRPAVRDGRPVAAWALQTISLTMP